MFSLIRVPHFMSRALVSKNTKNKKNNKNKEIRGDSHFWNLFLEKNNQDHHAN